MKTTVLLFVGLLASTMAAAAPERDEERRSLRGLMTPKNPAPKPLPKPTTTTTTTVEKTIVDKSFIFGKGGDGGIVYSGAAKTGDAIVHQGVQTESTGIFSGATSYAHGSAASGTATSGDSAGADGGSGVTAGGGRDLALKKKKSTPPPPPPTIPVKKTTVTTSTIIFGQGGDGGTVVTGPAKSGDATVVQGVYTESSGFISGASGSASGTATSGDATSGSATGGNGGDGVTIGGGGRDLAVKTKSASAPVPFTKTVITKTTYTGIVGLGGDGGYVGTGTVKSGDAGVGQEVYTSSTGIISGASGSASGSATSGTASSGSASGANGGNGVSLP